MTFPIHLCLSYAMRMCGGITVPGLASALPIKINNMVPAVEGDRDTHNNLGMLINVLQHNVMIGGIPAIPSIVSMASPDVLGLIPHVQGLPIPIMGSPNVMIGMGSGMAGLGMMQPILGGLGQIIGFNPLQIGELVSVAGQIIGTVQNFTQIGGGAAVAQLNNMQGTPITAGTTVTGQTSGVTFSFSNVIDSRVVSYEYSYPAVDTVTNALVQDDGQYIVIDDYFNLYPTQNLTASVITV
jgi:hypothetical protein